MGRGWITDTTKCMTELEREVMRCKILEEQKLYNGLSEKYPNKRSKRSLFSLDDAFVRYGRTTAREQIEHLVFQLLNHKCELYKLSIGDFDS
tara:strand:- start:148 stop:423 length:276 start_codon:yes stop_codon:yes gene_type:complete